MKVIHIADVTGDEIIKRNVNKVLLLGTKFTMESSFYEERLENKGIEVVIPNELDRQVIHDIIYNELILGVLKQESKQSYIKIINKMIEEEIRGVVLGCTEIPMLIKQGDVLVLVVCYHSPRNQWVFTTSLLTSQPTMRRLFFMVRGVNIYTKWHVL